MDNFNKEVGSRIKEIRKERGITQGIVGAFCIRISIAFLMSHIGNNSLFLIGLATPCSTVVQIIMCFVIYAVLKRKSMDKIVQT